ncbi:MFS transporter [Streptomyces roseirectus]|uniref:MFS transporter n=1 Tax=Streptomyces roseirectus TaxID=2768066 RepID=A0A7H0IIG6_9ACTN|nr:MFS transporter [Streptomyces roseirectus]QNP72582.1 MFS transporter [Streptomyces roseirectus]
MPVFLYVLGLAVFAQGTSEFMLSGLIPGIARELSVSVGAAASLTSAYAVGMVVGAPVMAVVGARLPRRAALGGFLGAFVVVHVVGAVTSDFAVLFGARVVAAVVNAGFLAVALSTATSLVAPESAARAASVLLAGVTLSCAVGVPAGALLGEWFGWRAAFWAVAGLCVPALGWVVRASGGGSRGSLGVRGSSGGESGGESLGSGGGETLRSKVGESLGGADKVPAGGFGVRAELRVLGRPVLRRALVMGAAVNGATFAGFSYLAVIGTDVAGVPSALVPVLLAVFGVGAFFGVTVAGRRGEGWVGAVLVVLPFAWGVLALAGEWAVVLFGGALMLGALSFGAGSALVGRVLSVGGGEAPVLAGAFATVALNLGAFVGPLVAGGVTEVSGDYRDAVWVSAGLAGVALVGGVVGRRGGDGDVSPGERRRYGRAPRS